MEWMWSGKWNSLHHPAWHNGYLPIHPMIHTQKGMDVFQRMEFPAPPRVTQWIPPHTPNDTYPEGNGCGLANRAPCTTQRDTMDTSPYTQWYIPRREWMWSGKQSSLHHPEWHNGYLPIHPMILTQKGMDVVWQTELPAPPRVTQWIPPHTPNDTYPEGNGCGLANRAPCTTQRDTMDTSPYTQWYIPRREWMWSGKWSSLYHPAWYNRYLPIHPMHEE